MIPTPVFLAIALILTLGLLLSLLNEIIYKVLWFITGKQNQYVFKFFTNPVFWIIMSLISWALFYGKHMHL